MRWKEGVCIPLSLSAHTAFVLNQHCVWSLEVNYVGPVTCRTEPPLKINHSETRADLTQRLTQDNTNCSTSAGRESSSLAQVITGHILFTSTLWLISFDYSGERVSPWTDSILKKIKHKMGLKFSGCVINCLHYCLSRTLQFDDAAASDSISFALNPTLHPSHSSLHPTQQQASSSGNTQQPVTVWLTPYLWLMCM